MNDTSTAPESSAAAAPAAPAAAPPLRLRQADRRRPSRWRAALTLLLIASTLAAGYFWLEARRVAAEQQALAAARAQEAEQAAAREKAAAARLEQAQRELQEARAALAAGAASALAEVPLVGDAATLFEIERLITLAAQDVQLTRQPATALAALELADARAAAANRAQWQPLRRALARDLERLRALPAPDITGTALKLDQLIAGASVWPLASTPEAPPPEPRTTKAASRRVEKKTAAPVDAKAAPAEEAAAPAPTAWTRLRAWLGSEFGHLLRIREVATPEALLLTDAQGGLARQQLKLRLLSARTALLARDARAYRSDIELAQSLLALYFDARPPAVVAAAAQLRQLATLPLAGEMPTVTESQRAVAALRAGLVR